MWVYALTHYQLIGAPTNIPGFPILQYPLPLAYHHHVPKWSSKEAYLVDTILNQPYRRRVSADGLNRKDSQLAASLEGEAGPTLAEKTRPHAFKFKRLTLK